VATNEDFDLSALFQGPGAVLAGALGMADNARKTIGGVMETIATLQRAAVAVEQLVSRMNRLVDDLEAPMRALTPELERSVARMQRLSAALEGPIDRLLPGLEAAVGTFDRVALSQLPETVEEARQQMAALLELFSEVPRRLGLLGGRSGLGALLPRSREAKPVSSPASAKPSTTKQGSPTRPSKAASAKATSAKATSTRSVSPAVAKKKASATRSSPSGRRDNR
jgi:hypothetical protein